VGGIGVAEMLVVLLVFAALLLVAFRRSLLVCCRQVRRLTLVTTDAAERNLPFQLLASTRRTTWVRTSPTLEVFERPSAGKALIFEDGHDNLQSIVVGFGFRRWGAANES